MVSAEPCGSCKNRAIGVGGARWLFLVFAAISAIAGPAAAQKNGADEPFVAAFIVDQALISFLDSTGQAAGFARDLTDAICVKLGRSVSYVPVSGRLEAREAVGAGETDFVVAVFGTIAEARWEYSRPILELSNRVFALGSREDLRRQRDLSGSKIGCLSGPMARRFEKRFEDIECVVYETVDEALADLIGGEIDSVAAPEEIVIGVIERSHPHREFKILGSPERTLPWHFAASAGNEELVASLDAAMAELRAEGEYDAIFYTWFPSSVSLGHVHWSTAFITGLVSVASILGMSALFLAMFGWRMRAARNRVLRMDRKQRQAREDHDRLVDMSNDLICVATVNGMLLSVNSAFERTLGYTQEKLLSTPFLELVHPDDVERTKDVLAGLERGEPVTHFENRYLHQDGSIVWLQWSSVPDEDRGVIHAVARDMTVLKEQDSIQEDRWLKQQRQQASIIQLATSEALIEGDTAAAAEMITQSATSIVDVARASVWLLSDDHRELRCVGLFDQPSGTHSQGEVLLAGDFPAYLFSLDSGRVIDASDACHDPRTLEFVESYFRPLGISSVLDAPIRVAGKVAGVVWLEHTGTIRKWTQDEAAFVSDIADQLGVVLANRQRVRAENEFRDLLESAPDSIIIVNSQGRISLVNQRAEEVFGYKRDEMLGRRIEMLVPSKYTQVHPGHIQSYFANPDRRLMGSGMELRGVRKDGAEFPIEISLSPIQIDGEMLAVSAVRDVSDRKAIEKSLKQHEDQIRHAQKLDAAGSLANGLAHDFNNLLFAIHSSVALAKHTLPTDHPAQQSLENVNEAVVQARGVTRSLLTFTRKEESVKGPVDLGKIVHSACDLLRDALPAAIDLQRQNGPAREVWVDADPTQLQQMVLNLAINSRDAMPDGGQLTIRVSTETARGKDAAILIVEDSGVGMTQETRDRIFEPYFTTKPRGQGTGLGMAVIHGIVQGHSGEISVHSKVGSGTQVRVALPRIKAPVPVDQAKDSEFEATPSSGIALLAEDNELARGATVSMLEMIGFDVVVAVNGKEALEKHESEQDRISLLVLDADMPFVSGPECIKKIRQGGCTTPALLITGGGSAQLVDGLEGRTNVLLKPFSLDDLSRRISEIQSTGSVDGIVCQD